MNSRLKILICAIVIASVAGVTAQAGAACWDWPAIFQKNARDKAFKYANVKLLVLPYQNQSGREQDAWFSDAFRIVISEYLDLGYKVAVLNIVPSIIKNIETNEVMSIGKSVGADYVLTGYFERVGDILRVSTKFVDVEKGEIQERLLGQVELSAPKRLGDFLNLVAKTTSDRIKKFRVKEKVLDKGKHEIRSIEAFKYYTLASIAWEKQTPHNIKVASDLYLEAIKADYNYAPAYIGHAKALLGLGFVAKMRGQQYKGEFEEAKRELVKAEALDKNYSEYYITDLKRYTESDVHEISATTYLSHNEDEKAMREFATALDILPGNVRVANQLAAIYAKQRREGEAAQLSQWVREVTEAGEESCE